MSGFGEDRGQATVELALILPILVLGVALLVHVSMLIGVQIGLEHAAREGARAAAVEPERAADAATLAAAGDGTNAVQATVGPTFVTVTVSREVEVVPLLAGLARRTLVADATMRREDLLGP